MTTLRRSGQPVRTGGTSTSAAPGFEASRQQREQLSERFFAAAEDGDLDALESLLAEDVVLHGDGGGKAPAVPRPLHGRRRVAQTIAGWIGQGKRLAGVALRAVEVNGQPGATILARDGGLIGVMALDIADGQIQSISSVVNPDKLGHIAPLGDLRQLLGRRER